MFQRDDVKRMNVELHEALKAFEEKNNVKVSWGNVTFSEEEFHMTVKVESNDLYTEEAVEKKFRETAFLYGLKPKDYKRKFTSKGELYELIGFQPNRDKYPLLARRVKDGKEILFTRDIVRLFEKEDAACI